MTAFSDAFAAGVWPALQAVHGESVTLTLHGGSGASVTAVVTVGTEGVEESGGTREVAVGMARGQFSVSDYGTLTLEKDQFVHGGVTYTVMEQLSLEGGVREVKGVAGTRHQVGVRARDLVR